MKTVVRNLKSPLFVSLFLTTPFIFLEVVNRRNFKEDFPYVLFFVLLLNLFAINLILLPIVQASRAGNQDSTNPVPAQGGTLFTYPRSALMISVSPFLVPVILFFLTSLDLAPLDRFFNGPNPEQPYIPGQILALVLISIPVAAGMIAVAPIVRTLRAGGSLFAHPIHLLLVAVILVLFAMGLAGLIVDQWPCFMGVPNCD